MIFSFAKNHPNFIWKIIVEPHRVIIKNITFLVFNYSNDVYISDLNKKIKLSVLEEYLKNI